MSVGKVVSKADYDTNSGTLAAQISEWAQDVLNLSSNVIETWCPLCEHFYCAEHDVLPDGHRCLRAVTD